MVLLIENFQIAATQSNRIESFTKLWNILAKLSNEMKWKCDQIENRSNGTIVGQRWTATWKGIETKSNGERISNNELFAWNVRFYT